MNKVRNRLRQSIAFIGSRKGRALRLGPRAEVELSGADLAAPHVKSLLARGVLYAVDSSPNPDGDEGRSSSSSRPSPDVEPSQPVGIVEGSETGLEADAVAEAKPRRSRRRRERGRKVNSKESNGG